MSQVYIASFFFSADAKANRASEHFKALNEEMLAWHKNHPISTRVEHNVDATEYSVYLKVAQEPPWTQWSLIFSDCLHNFRSCLDNAIYGLAVAHSGQSPPPDAGRLAFPIADKPNNFAGSLGSLGELRKNAAIKAAIEGLQPYNRPNSPHPATLTLLRNLNDIDKHRVLNITRAAAKGGRFELSNPPPGAKVDFRVFSRSRLEDGALLQRLSFDRPAANMGMEGNFTTFPAIRHPDASGNPHDFGIDWILSRIQDEVTYCLTVLKDLLPQSVDEHSEPIQ